jgi:hypothetical protein
LIDSARDDIEQVLASGRKPWLRRGGQPANAVQPGARVAARAATRPAGLDPGRYGLGFQLYGPAGSCREVVVDRALRLSVPWRVGSARPTTPSDAQANVQSKPVAEAKAPVPTPAKPVASKKAQSTKVADKAAAETARKVVAVWPQLWLGRRVKRRIVSCTRAMRCRHAFGHPDRQPATRSQRRRSVSTSSLRPRPLGLAR